MSIKNAPFGQNIADELSLIRDVLSGSRGNVVYGFHVNSNESDPSSAVTYLRDAVGMTPSKMNYTYDKFDFGSWSDVFFLPRPCMLKYDGTVDYYLNPYDLTKKVDGTSSDVANASYGGNAMVEWGQNGKKIWTKVVADTDDANSYSVYIADHKEDDGFHAWSFINNQNVMVNHFYTPIYNGSLDASNRLRSLSGQALMDSKSGTAENGYAKANNPSGKELWYTETFADCQLINFLLILMGKSLDTKSVFGQGNTTGGQSSTQGSTTGTLNTKGMFYGSTSTTQQMKVFFMENYWGHQWRRIAGLMNSDNNYYYKLTYGNADGSSITSYGTSVSGMLDGGSTPTSDGWQKKRKVVNGSIILPSDVNGSSSTYYCDYNWNSTSTTYALRGGASNNGAYCGAFSLSLHVGVGNTYWSFGASLSCKPLASVG